MTKLSYSQLHEAAKKAVALRTIVRLAPAGGDNAKIFPPTYMGGVHAFETRRIRDEFAPGGTREVACVLLDAVASQANRMEDALQRALDAKEIGMPQLVVNFSAADKTLVDPVSRVTSLQAPHRWADAIIRDSEIGGVAFRATDLGKALTNASARDAVAIFEACPLALVFGVWDSTGPKGGLGAKFARALSCEIIGVDAIQGKKTSSRIDPLQISSKVPVMKTAGGDWSIAKDGAKGAVKASEVNHSNQPPDIADGGVTIAYAEQTCVLSLAALRKLGFGHDTKKAEAARALLAALGLLAYAKTSEQGWDLRSRCLLVPTGPVVWEVLASDGKTTAVEVDAEIAVKVYHEAVAAARKAGLVWNETPVELTPSAKLVELVKKSQSINAKEAAEEAGA